jgi:hypothetical protein
MMLPGGRLQVGCALLGVALIAVGLALVTPRAGPEDLPVRSQRAGRSDFTPAARRQIAPWLLGGGLAACAVAYLLRAR